MKTRWEDWRKTIILGTLLALGMAGAFLLYAEARNRGFLSAAKATIPSGPGYFPMEQPTPLAAEEEPTFILHRSNLELVVAASGIFCSRSAHEVYTPLSHAVSAVYVEMGDAVAEGQPLCQLDTAEIKHNIRDVESKIAKGEKSDAAKLAQAQQKLSQLQKQMAEDDVSREKEITAALEALEAAKVKEATAAADSQVSSTEIELARVTHEEATQRLLETPEKLDDGTPNPEYALRLEEEQTAQNNLDIAFDVYTKAWQAVYSQVYNSSHPTAATEAYAAAKAHWENAARTAQLALDNAAAAVENCRLADSAAEHRIKLEGYQRELEQATLTAPVSGKITAVGALVGKKASAASSPLFVVQGTEELEVQAVIPEKDALNLYRGMPATITTNALSKQEWPGVVSSLSPVAEKGDFTVIFRFEPDTRQLKPGMTANIHVVTGTRQGVFAVPHNILTKNAQGHTVVYAESSDGSAPREIEVLSGGRGSLRTEIEGEELVEGMLLLTSPPQQEAA